MNTLISRNGNLFTPRRVDLFGEMTKEVDRVVNEVFGAPFFNTPLAGKRGKGYPLMDAIRTETRLILHYTVPGVKKDDLTVEILEEDGAKLLSVGGLLHEDYIAKESDYQIRELSSQEFKRIIKLPEDIDNSDPISSLNDGILTITFMLNKAKEQKQKTKKINIQ